MDVLPFPPSRPRENTGFFRTLGRITEHAARNDGVRKSDLCAGDRVIVRTRNSVYSLRALGDGTFVVSGGWFDAQRISPTTLGVNGCTWGGRALRPDLVAAPGLFLEFENAVCTTRIRSVQVVRGRGYLTPT